MLNKAYIENLSREAARLFPAAEAVRKDLEVKLYGLMKSSFERLNLVTREEFDAQAAVLERANRTLAELEKKLAELEARIDDRGNSVRR